MDNKFTLYYFHTGKSRKKKIKLNNSGFRLEFFPFQLRFRNIVFGGVVGNRPIPFKLNTDRPIF
jgi:hypothetical protein